MSNPDAPDETTTAAPTTTEATTPDEAEDERQRKARFQKLLDQVKSIRARPPLEKRQRRA